MYNSIEKIFQRYGNKEPIKIITIPSTEAFEVELCKTLAEVYVINNGRTWNTEYERPENHFLLSENQVNMEVQYDLFIVPSLSVPPQVVSQVMQRLQVPMVVVNDREDEASVKEREGMAKNIPPSSPEFVSYWSDIINKLTRI